MREIKSAVITGPTGAIGTALCRLLISEGIKVYAVVRRNSSRITAIPESEMLNIVSCDLENISSLPDKIPSADAFFHLAWANTIGDGRNDMLSQTENIRASVEAAKAAAKLGCKVFIGAGSQAEYGRVEGKLKSDTPCFPENGYGIAKLCAGSMTRIECGKNGVDHIWVRILSVYGPHDGPMTMISGTIRKLLSGEVPKLTPGEQKWDYLYSEDAAKALLLAARRGKCGSVYPLGSGRALPLREYIEILRDTIDPALKLGFGKIEYAPNQVMHLEADISQLYEDTGFKPETQFCDGIKKTIEWVRNEVK
ncbi:MAG: NAD(P)-dependent oxidoreductase [Oscillospiraceae bacterium]|nr:NAD(P)-dependent oxidoreductase [Oscillospiraceae bacterium]